MIELKRLNGSPLAVNCDLIKYAEASPDTVLTLITGEKLIVRKVEDTIRKRQLTEPGGKFASRNALQTFTLLETIEEFGFDACIGGRSEERRVGKECVP